MSDEDTSETLFPDRRPAFGLLVLSAALLVAGVVLAWKVGPTIGVTVGVLAILLQVAMLVWLIPSRTYLHLTDRGFIACTWFRCKRVEWADVDRFGVVADEGEPRVAWNYVPDYPAELIDRERTKNRTGFEAILPRCCRLEAEPLAAMLNRRKQQATAG